jgi:hypothetical protein
MRENANRFGEDIDRGLLLRFSKYQELWVVEGGDLMIFVARLNGVFLGRRSNFPR